jgi:iron complex transport system substrate-binding protein
MAPFQARSVTRAFSARLAALACLVVVALSHSMVHAQARRIVSIIPATTEMLFAMGAGDRLVAVGTYDRFPKQVDTLPRVGALLDPDVERIISLRPDLVILYGTQADLRSQLERAQIPYYPYTHKADALAAALERQIADVRAKVASRPRPKTLLVFGRERGTLRGLDASGGYGFLHDMLDAAGGTNVVSDVRTQAVQMSTEMVLGRAPDVIIELHYGRGDTTTQADMKAWDALPSVPAVRNKRVYLLQGEEFVVPGPRVGAATERLSRILHPEVWR